MYLLVKLISGKPQTKIQTEESLSVEIIPKTQPNRVKFTPPAQPNRVKFTCPNCNTNKFGSGYNDINEKKC